MGLADVRFGNVQFGCPRSTAFAAKPQGATQPARVQFGNTAAAQVPPTRLPMTPPEIKPYQPTGGRLNLLA